MLGGPSLIFVGLAFLESGRNTHARIWLWTLRVDAAGWDHQSSQERGLPMAASASYPRPVLGWGKGLGGQM